MLIAEPELRITAKKALELDWLTKTYGEYKM